MWCVVSHFVLLQGLSLKMDILEEASYGPGISQFFWDTLHSGMGYVGLHIEEEDEYMEMR